MPSQVFASRRLRAVVRTARIVLFILAPLPLRAQLPAAARADTIDRYARFFGNYRRTDTEVVSVGRDDDGRMFVMDYRRGVRHWVHAQGDTLVEADGERYSLRGGDTLVARGWTAARVALRTEPIVATNGAVHLEGTLWLPAGPGPFPAVILVQGAGEETRHAMRQFPYYLVSRGFAVVSYDKRGSGASTGDWHPWEAGIDALAGDALALWSAVRGRAGIAPSRVGMLGISNGAWVVERAAAREPKVAFIVPVSGGGVRIADSERYRLARAAEAAHLDRADRLALDHFVGEVYSPALLATPASSEGQRVVQRIRDANGTRWFTLTPLTPFAAAPAGMILDLGGRAWARELSYAPDSDLVRVHVPILAIGGSSDVEVPESRSLAGIRRAGGADGHGRVTTLLLPGASHALIVRRDPHGEDVFAPALFPALGRWLTSAVVR